MKKKKKWTPFALHGTELFVDARHSGIHPLVLLIDGLPLVRFGKEKRTYLRVEDVARWHRKELQESNGRSGNLKVAEALEKALEDFRNGNMVEE